VAALATATGCGAEPVAVPKDLLGLWKTESPRHAKTFLEIRSHSLMLGVAGMELDVLEIEGLEHATDRGGNDVYRFHYTADEGYPDVLVVTRLRSSRGILVASGSDVWRPASHR
jgi:hypothetical protein